MATTDEDISFIFKIFIFYFVYTLILNMFSFAMGVPSWFNIDATGGCSINGCSIIQKTIGSLTLGNFSGIPFALNMLLIIIGVSFITIPLVIFVMNKIRGI